MSATAMAPARASRAEVMAMVKRVAVGGTLAGLVGGAAMIVLMILVMGTSGSGYASPLNLGIPAFVKTITPPPRMFPSLIGLMGIHVPATAMAQVGPALSSGRVSGAMLHQLDQMLAAMHVPAAKVQMMGALMSGHASNATMADLLSGMSPSARSAVMSAMPVTAGHVAIGTVTHFALSAILGMTFAMLILGLGIRTLSISALRSPAGIIVASLAGGALVYVVNRWLILPAIDPLMRLVPETAFFIAHLLFGLVVGIGLTMLASREGGLQRGGVGTGALA